MYKTFILVLLSTAFFGCNAEAPNAETAVKQTNTNMPKSKRDAANTFDVPHHNDEQANKNQTKQKQPKENLILAKNLPKDLHDIVWNDFIEPYENARVLVEEKDLNHDGTNEFLIYIVDEGDGKIIPLNARQFWIVGKENGKAVSLVPAQLSANKLKFIARNEKEFDDIEFVGSDVEDFGTGDTTKTQAKNYINTYRMFDEKYYWCAAREEESGKAVELKNFSAAFKQYAHPGGKQCEDASPEKPKRAD